MAIVKRKMNVNSTINVTPMVDVMLVLLIIFMVITPMLQQGVSVDLAKTDNPIQMPDADKEDALAGRGHPGRQDLFRRRQVTPDQLTNKVKDRLAGGPISKCSSKPMPAPSTAMWSRSWMMSVRPEWTTWAC